MTTITEPVFIDLPPTSTYRRRRATWYAGEGTHTDGRLGTLRVVQDKAKRSGDSSEVDEYGIQKDTDPAPPECVAVLVLNDTAPAEEGERRSEIYRVVVGKLGTACTCRAGQTGKACKHAAAVVALLNREIL